MSAKMSDANGVPSQGLFVGRIVVAVDVAVALASSLDVMIMMMDSARHSPVGAGRHPFEKLLYIAEP
jgi:hypothetical protein